MNPGPLDPQISNTCFSPVLVVSHNAIDLGFRTSVRKPAGYRFEAEATFEATRAGPCVDEIVTLNPLRRWNRWTHLFIFPNLMDSSKLCPLEAQTGRHECASVTGFHFYADWPLLKVLDF